MLIGYLGQLCWAYKQIGLKNTLAEENLFIGTGYTVFYFNIKKKLLWSSYYTVGEKITFKVISQFKKMGMSNEGKIGGLEPEEANVM